MRVVFSVSQENYYDKTICEILEFLSYLESGDFSKRLSCPEAPSNLSPIIDKLNDLSHMLAAQAQTRLTSIVMNADDAIISKDLNGASKIARDITERKRTEQELAQARTTMIEAQKIAHLGSFEYVAATKTTVWSEEECRIYGLDPAGPSPTYDVMLKKCIHPDDAALLHSTFTRAIQNKSVYELEHRIVRPNGEVRWVYDRAQPYLDVHGELLRYIGITLDITERKRLEEEGRQREEFLLFSLESLEAGAWELNLVNHSAYRTLRHDQIFGYQDHLPQWTYEMFLEHVLPEDRQEVDRKFQESVATHGKWNFECRILRRDGEIRWISASGIHQFNKVGQPTKMIGVVRDIDQQKRAQEALRAAKFAAESANRSKDLFLATLSHELRSPLTAILSWSQLIERGMLPSEKVKTGIRTIKENALSQNQLISDLLDISRIITGKMMIDQHPTSMLDVLMTAIETVRPIAEQKSITIEESVEATDLFVSVDSARLKQVLWNILSNSIKFTPEGGKIIIMLDCAAERQARQARITIQDTGKGIKAEFLPHIFERFSQADSSSIRIYGGMGLGLSLVKSLVELQGGTVTASSPGEGKGATFTVTFPLLWAESVQPRPSIPAVAQMPSLESLNLSGLKVLLVEDEEKTRVAVDQMLASRGANVKSVSSAKGAIEVFGEFHPDVIVSDIAMPEEDGYSLIRRIRKLGHENGGDTPAVAFTAYADPTNRKEAFAAGFQAHLAKPFEFDELARTILKVKNAS